MVERWEYVPGYAGRYRVSDQGRVQSMLTGRVLQPTRSGNGYRKVTLCGGGVKRHRNIHRLVAEAFIPNPENKPEINHKDGNKANNAADNLEWTDRHGNQLHCRRDLGTWCGAPKKPVVCIETGKEYSSAAEAAQDIGASRSGVTLVCIGRNKTIKNLHFKFKED